MSMVMHKSASVFRWVNLMVAWLALSVALLGYFNNFGTATLPKWSALEVAILPALAAFGLALCVFDSLHLQRQSTTVGDARKHMLVVVAVFLALFLLQYIGVQLVLASPTSAL
jgi:hypothetical protein